MKTFRILFLLTALTSIAFIFSCKKDSSNNPGAPTITINRPAYEKKWNISTLTHRPVYANSGTGGLFNHPKNIAHRPEGVDGYDAIEFTINSYVIFYSDGSLKVGNYTAASDTTLVLDSLGTLHIISVTDAAFSFVITPFDSSIPIIITATPAPLTQPANSVADSAFYATTWILDSSVWDGYSDTTGYSEYQTSAIFSQYGTYLVRDHSFDGTDEYSTNSWLWSNDAHSALCYGAWDGTNLTDCSGGAGTVTMNSFQPPYTSLILGESTGGDTTSNILYYLHKQ